ncbi:permease [Bacillus sp. NPDC094077]|uniref:permease n=1 Tax=Bacillus sp. NPDC094077 TaxID=3390932 RepID=UPI003CFFA804
MQSSYICHACNKRIARKKDLITATWYFRFYLFHNNCFKQQQLLISRFIPINTLFGFFLIIYGLIVGSILMITEPSIIWFVFLLPTFYRFLSYYYVERFFSK